MAEDAETDILEVLEDEDYNTVWRTVQYDSEQWETPRSLWEIDPAAKNRLASAPQAPVFIPFLNPFDPNNESAPVMLLSDAMWTYLRGIVKNKRPPNWSRMARERRKLQVTLQDGQRDAFSQFEHSTPQINDRNDRSAYWVDTFDVLFSMAQQEQKVKEAAQKLGKAWVLVTDVPWKERTGGSWDRGGTDMRKFRDRTDGFGFVLRGWGGVPPLQDDQYVRLDRADAQLLLLGDPSALYRGVSADQVFIPVKVLNALKDGTYPFGDHGNAVALRNATGDIGYVQCQGRTTSQQFWRDAYENGMAPAAGWKVARWRNAKIHVCLVVTGTSTTAEELRQAVDQVNTDAVVTIQQVVTVVDGRDNKDEAFDHYLGLSPLRDYETWITEADYISYLQAYPGYTLPTEKQLGDMTKAIQGMLDKRSAKVTRQDETFRNGLKLAADKLDPLRDAGVTATRVSFSTISGASGRRSQAPSQRQQMGGSATTVARLAGWPHAEFRLLGEGNWDSPGCYPAEWLHRSAFSWGHVNDFAYSQATSNFVFGSSEANSLMTRYEKAWQRLFIDEWDLRKQLGTHKRGILPDLEGVLITSNTPDDADILTTILAKDGKSAQDVRLRKVQGHEYPIPVDGKDKPIFGPDGRLLGPSDGAATWPDYWAVARKWPNLSGCLTYRLQLFGQSELGVSTGLATAVFYPFQRGFYTRVEGEVDCALLDNRDCKIGTKPVGDEDSAMVPAPAERMLVGAVERLALNDVDGVDGVDGVNGANGVNGAPHSGPGDRWREARRGEPVRVGGVALSNPNLATLDESGRMVHIPLPLEGAAPQTTALVARAPLVAAGTRIGSATGDRAPIDAVALDAVTRGSELAPGGAGLGESIPAGFVLQGTVKLFGKFDAPMYVYHGPAAEGERQIVPIAGVVDTIEQLIPGLGRSDYGTAVQFKNTELVYNQLSTAAYAAGTWLQSDVVFSGPLQPVSDCLRNVFGQADPAVRLQALLTPKNDWSKPFAPNGISLRGSLPGMHVQLGNLLRITELGIDVSLIGTRQPWKPYDMAWSRSIGFSGSALVEMPKNAAPLSASFLMAETNRQLTLMVLMKQFDGPGFAGVAGLKLSSLTLQTSLGFGPGAPASVTDFTASAALGLRDSTLQLYGYYSKADWGLTCDLYDFTFADLRAMYQDLFGAELHVTGHNIELDHLSFMAQPSGLTINGLVTVEGHTSATATITMGRNGLDIRGAVADVPIEGDIVLKKASFDIFVGRQDTLPLAKPGTSFRFAIQGVVDVAGSELLASMYLGRNNQGQALWTVVGGFKGAFSLSKIAPALRGSFLDLSVQEVTLIASNTDGAAAVGADIPAAYPVVKGVQIAGALGPIPPLDGALGLRASSGNTVTGLTLRAMYAASSSAFDLAIDLRSPRQMSIKSGTVYSGPISLLIQASPAPTLAIDAAFFVRVPNQADPLRFDGGLSVNIAEARLFIELANQWWQNPLGLSPQLKLGPDLALQIGIVYASPVYPSEIGVAAGLAVGNVTGKAALSISDSPSDELVMMHIENLGIRDLVRFADLLLQVQLPEPDNFLLFKNLDFYLSSGTTIGTAVYPPGASFSCDAVLFDHEAAIGCTVSKAQEQIEVKGSLQAIDIGPLQVSGYKAGAPARFDVQFGPQQQTLLIDGGVSLFDIAAKLLVKADIISAPSFQLETELDFTAHLTFQLQADMRSGSFTGPGGLGNLDFDVHAVFQQDICAYIASQVNDQVLAAKKAVDDGVEAAEKSLDQAQAAYQASVAAAEAKVSAAQAAFEAKLDQAKSALAAEEQRGGQRREQLAAAAARAEQSWTAALDAATQNLQAARDTQAREVQAAEQKVRDARSAADRQIDQHLRDLNNAKDDMNRRFGDAIAKVDAAEASVDSLRGQVDAANRALDQARANLANASVLGKIAAAFEVAAQETRLGSVQAALSAAEGVLQGAKAVISGPGYAAAQASVDAYQQAVDTARATADASVAAANGTLEATRTAQDGLVAGAQAALQQVKTSGVEKAAVDAARGALGAFDAAEGAALTALRDAVAAVGGSAEAAAFGAAKAGLQAARAGTAAVDGARAAVRVARESGEAVLSAAAWLASHAATDILDVRRVEVSGDLRVAVKEAALSARLEGTVAGQSVDFSVGFTPGKGEDMVKSVFATVIDKIKDLSIRL